jgi:hypothetical protein
LETKILLTVTKAEFLDTGHEIESLFCLKGCKVLDVEDQDETVCLTVEHANPFMKEESRSTASNKQIMPLKYPCSVCGSNADCFFVGSDPCPRR